MRRSRISRWKFDKRARRFVACAGWSTVALVGSFAHGAATFSWATNSSGNWSGAGNWSSSTIPPAGSIALLDRASATPTITYNSAAGNRSISQLIANENFVINGGQLGFSASTLDTQFKQSFVMDDGILAITDAANV